MSTFSNKENNNSHNNEKSKMSTCECIFSSEIYFCLMNLTPSGREENVGSLQGNRRPEEGLLPPAWAERGLGLAGCFNLLLEVFLLFTFINLFPGLRASPPSPPPAPQFHF